MRRIETKYCKFCGNKIDIDAVICPKCGKQVEEFKTEEEKSSPQVVINNTNSNVTRGGKEQKECDKWIALILCIFLGWLGVHKFYEEKIGLGILYLITLGLCGVGIVIDIIIILCKPNPYYV